MKTYYDVLKSFGACITALEARKNLTVEEAMQVAERGDWILWLASKLNLNQRKITLAKARSAATVKHLMKDIRSLKALEVAEQFGLGKATEEDLKIAADAAYDASADAADAAYAADAADAAASAAADTAYAASAAASAAVNSAAAASAAVNSAAAASAYAAAAYATAARKKNQLETAKICVGILGKDIIAEVNKLIKESI